MTRIAIVEDHQLLAETFAAALTSRGMDAVIVPLHDPAALPAVVIRQHPQLVVLDLDLGALGDSTRLIAPMVRAGIKVMVLTGATDRLRIAAALEQGALGYRHKSIGFSSLVEAIEQAARTDGVLDPDERNRLLAELAHVRGQRARQRELFHRLTERERATLEALAQGRAVHEIAQAWVLSDATVRTHVRSVLAKLGVRSQLAAVSMALRNGWIDSAARLLDEPVAR